MFWDFVGNLTIYNISCSHHGFGSIFADLEYDTGLIPTSQRIEGSPGYQDHSTGKRSFGCTKW